MFGEDAEQIKNIYVTDWTQEQYSSVTADHRQMSTRPNYGYDTNIYDNKLQFVGTESAFEDGGYLEGCIVSVESLVKKIGNLIGSQVAPKGSVRRSSE